MAACLNRISMNIIKNKCIGNRNLEYISISKDYDTYCNYVNTQCSDPGIFFDYPYISEEEFMFVKTWINKKPRTNK